MRKTVSLTQTLIVVFLVSIFSSCHHNGNDAIVHIDLNEALKNPSDFKLSDIVKDAEIITLDTVPDAYFVNAGGLSLYNSARKTGETLFKYH